MATAPSFTSDATSTKKDEGYSRAVVAAEPSSGLPAINDEDEGDEAEKVAGEVAQVFTEEEQNAVRRKIDRRVRFSSLFATLVSDTDPFLLLMVVVDCSAPHGCLLLPVPRQGTPPSVVLSRCLLVDPSLSPLPRLFTQQNSINYSSVMGLPITGEHYNLCAMVRLATSSTSLRLTILLRQAFYLGFLLFEMPQSALAARFPRAK